MAEKKLTHYVRQTLVLYRRSLINDKLYIFREYILLRLTKYDNDSNYVISVKNTFEKLH